MDQIRMQTRFMRYEVSAQGENVYFGPIHTEENLIEKTPCAALVTQEHQELRAVSASMEAEILHIGFEDGTTADVSVGIHENYITFTLKQVSREDFLAIAFVNIRIHDGRNFAGSLMGMTCSTRMLEHPGRNRLLRAEAYPFIGLYSTAKSPYPAKAAVIGCPKDDLRNIQREVLEEIPDGELPKTKKGGPYADLAVEEARAGYTIINGETVTMENIDSVITDLKKFGLSQVNLHHFSHYLQGEFTCRKEYRGGLEEFRKVVDRFHQEGILVGIHPYAFFLVWDSKYVTPVPHKDLDVQRTFTLAEPMDERASELKVQESTEGVTAEFYYVKVSSPYLWIDDELVRFERAEDGRFILTERGAYGTVPATHLTGTAVKQLKCYFFLPLAKAGSELFYEIARNLARFYNESGADCFYIDALDGAAVLDGEDYVWYHAMDFVCEMYRYLERDPIFDCCFNPQYTGTWYARSRYGAIDDVVHGHRRAFDVHMRYNRDTAQRMGVTPELGWVDLYPVSPGAQNAWQQSPVYPEDVEDLCAKAFVSGACVSLLPSFRRYPDCPVYDQLAPVLRKYSDFVKNNLPTDEATAWLTEGDNSACLHEDGLYRVKHQCINIERNGDAFRVKNPFREQQPSIRIEAFCSADDYDSQSIELCAMDENKPVENMQIRFDEPVCSQGMKGLGVWCRGDGSGMRIAIQLRNLKGNTRKRGEHFIHVDFEGWRYFAFYENQNGTVPQDEWPTMEIDYKTYSDLQDFYGYYHSSVNYDAIDGVDILVQGEGKACMKNIRLLKHRDTVWENPTLTVGGAKITFHTALQSNTVLRFDGKACTVQDRDGKVLSSPQWEGEICVPNGEYSASLSHEAEEQMVRARLTMSFTGEKLMGNK